DRLTLLAENLTLVGATARVEGDDLVVEGSDVPLAGIVGTEGDHRIAMAFQVLGLAPGCAITVDDPGCADVSFPGFAATLADLEARR
ncbi:MAG: 3-phosphoshikimate 1-carboxyvinyltransferase, partial [Gemmatimonadetes bacterium]|nr:3-phosphoshikimate 1-carboxyvinyltransferase [Gemmatimonadota bacterium]